MLENLGVWHDDDSRTLGQLLLSVIPQLFVNLEIVDIDARWILESRSVDG